MAEITEELAQRIAEAKKRYVEYAAEAQKSFVAPVAHISIEPQESVTEVHIDVTSQDGTNFHFQSMQEQDAETVYEFLNKHPIVRERYADGTTPTAEATAKRIKQLADRYKTEGERSPLHLYSGFTVTDADTGAFLGMCNIGGGTKPGYAEMARLNRPEAWSHSPADVVERYVIPTEKRITEKHYADLGTIESSTLFQYTTRLKADGYKVNGEVVTNLAATNRIDNPGAWQSNARAGFELDDVDQRLEYGTALRYQVRKPVF